MLECYHAPAAFADRKKPLVVQVILPDRAEVLDKIDLLANNGAEEFSLRMLPVDGIVTGESYSLYGAEIPTAKLANATALSYRFCRGGEESAVYSVPVETLSPIPPLMITELLPWCDPYSCMELYNTTDETLDLYDFDAFLASVRFGNYRNPMAHERGVHLIPPHTPAIFRFNSELVKKAKGFAPGKEAFYTGLAQRYPATCADLAERVPLFFECDVTEERDGEYRSLPGCFDQNQRAHAYTLSIVPRGGNRADAVFTIKIGVDEMYHDAFPKKASVWYLDPENPNLGIIYDAFRAPTFGFNDPVKAPPEAVRLAPPAILPVFDAGSVVLTGADLSLRFAVLGGQSAYPALWVKNEAGNYLSFHLTEDTDGYWGVVLPYRLISRLSALEYFVEVWGGGTCAQYGTQNAPICLPIVDKAGPGILSVYPAEGQVLEHITTPTVRVEYEDISGVNLPLSILCLDGRNVTPETAWHGEYLEYTPEKPLTYGNHVLEITLRDMLGNRTYRKFKFAVGRGRKMNCYIGQVHCHTEDSDGTGTPEEALIYARDVGEVDYFAITDHSHLITPDRYAAQVELANRYNKNGSFAAIYGFEMSWNYKNGYWGHMNVLNTKWYERMMDEVNLPEFYEKLKAHPEGVAMFNHPGDNWGNFHDYAYRDAEIDKIVRLAEIRGGLYDREYAMQLSKGWHASPVYNEDNHRPNWTRGTNACGVVLAPTLTRENILDAMRRGRTYTTLDRSTKVYYRINGEWLGSTLQAPQKLTVSVEVHTEHESGIGLIELMSEDNIVAAHVDVGALADFTWNVELDPDFDYYYVRITADRNYTVTAPVYIEGRDLLNIVDFSYGQCEDEKEFHVAALALQNSSEKTMNDVRVDFYLTPNSGFELRSLVPYTSVYIGKLEAGKRHAVSRRLPDVPGKRRLTAVVSGNIGKKRYADTSYILLTPAIISKILPLTSPVEKEGVTVENPFAYIELYNPTPATLHLKDYSLRMWEVLGKAPTPERTLVFDGEIIPPNSTLTVWCRPAGTTLTAEDFNARYGTSLMEGEDLLITEMPILNKDPYGRRIDLCCRKETIARVPYGCFCTRENDIVTDVPILCAYTPDMTTNERKITSVTEPVAPGRLLPEQKPRKLNGLCRKEEEEAKERADSKQKLLTKLTHAPLVPFEAALLVANAISAVKGLFREKK